MNHLGKIPGLTDRVVSNSIVFVKTTFSSYKIPFDKRFKLFFNCTKKKHLKVTYFNACVPMLTKKTILNHSILIWIGFKG